MNNFFQPQAATMPTITNFENGQTFTAFDVFRNLFRSDISATYLFGSGEEWNLQDDLQSAIRQMLFGNYYAIGTNAEQEPSEEDVKRFKKEMSEVVDFLLFNEEESPLCEFKKTFRRFLQTKQFNDFGLLEEHKALNLEKLEEFLKISIPSDIAQYSDCFHLGGESGDWYMVEFGAKASNSFCFQDTQIKTLVRFIRRVLNVHQNATDRATMRFEEGFTIEQVTEDLANAYSVASVISKALQDCKKVAKKAKAFKLYGGWVVDYECNNRDADKDSEVYEFENQQLARQYVNARNAVAKADRERKQNIDKIAELKNSLAECLALLVDFDKATDQAIAQLVKAERLARPLQVA
jgi:hypothetical protein